MIETSVAEYFILSPLDLSRLVEALRRRGYQVLGPKAQDGELVFGELTSATALPVGWTDRQGPGFFRLVQTGSPAYFGCGLGQQSLKKFLFPAEVCLWEAQRQGQGWQIIPNLKKPPPYALLGVRACDLAALAVHDRVFLTGRYADPVYQERRTRAFIVAVHCTRSGGTCFCASLGTGPRATGGFDLALTEVMGEGRHYFLVEVGTPKGAEVLGDLEHQQAEAAEVAAAEALVAQAAQNQTRKLNTSDLKEFLYDNFESPHWGQVATRCLSCGNCAMVCPTCFCHRMEDTLDLNGQVTQRWRRLDVCFSVEHSYIHGGAIRPSIRARYRQWLLHKLATWVDQFGCLGCVGCGRCITWCPVGIDLIEEVQALRDAAGRK